MVRALYKGYFMVARHAFHNPIFRKERFSEREAYIWLIQRAAFRDHTVWWAGKPWHLNQGEQLCSIRYMMQETGWGQRRVYRFLQMLEKEGMIFRTVHSDGMHIVLRHYRAVHGMHPKIHSDPDQQSFSFFL